MKKSLMFVAVLFILPICVNAADVGQVVETDIVTFIDQSPIDSYNYKGYTYVVAEDLMKYGFDVQWDSKNRSLNITRKKYAFTPFVSDSINVLKKPITNQPLYQVYETDIKTQLNGVQITAYNIGGHTILNTDYLQAFGNCTYDNNSRRYDVDILGKEIEICKVIETRKNEDGYESVETEKGIFDGDTLLYGIKTSHFTSRYRDTTVIQSGDFQNGSYIESSKGIAVQYNGVTFYTPRQTSSTETDDTFRYGIKLRSILESGENAKEYRYLKETGELYLVKPTEIEPSNDTDTLSFFGQLYKAGKLIYDGVIIAENDMVMRGDDRLTFKILYAKGYTDDNGIIYNYDTDCPFYKGNVVNGVAHGVGVMLGERYWDEHTGEYPVYQENGTSYLPYIDSTIIYQGQFCDGLIQGQGKMYLNGRLCAEGNWNKNQKNGLLRIYENTTDGKTGEAMFLSYVGNYVADKRVGYGIEYGELGWAFYSGIYQEFIGDWKDGSWSKGKWYVVAYDNSTNNNFSRLYYNGEFRYDNTKAYGTQYYYKDDNSFETKTGYFLNWEFVG
jgi:hypothetical protein